MYLENCRTFKWIKWITYFFYFITFTYTLGRQIMYSTRVKKYPKTINYLYAAHLVWHHITIVISLNIQTFTKQLKMYPHWIRNDWEIDITYTSDSSSAYSKHTIILHLTQHFPRLNVHSLSLIHAHTHRIDTEIVSNNNKALYLRCSPSPVHRSSILHSSIGFFLLRTPTTLHSEQFHRLLRTHVVHNFPKPLNSIVPFQFFDQFNSVSLSFTHTIHTHSHEDSAVVFVFTLMSKIQSNTTPIYTKSKCAPVWVCV